MIVTRPLWIPIVAQPALHELPPKGVSDDMSLHHAITNRPNIREPSWNSGLDWPLDDKGFWEKGGHVRVYRDTWPTKIPNILSCRLSFTLSTKWWLPQRQMDAKESGLAGLMNTGTDFTTSHRRKATGYIDNSLFGLGSRHDVSKHMVAGHDNLAYSVSLWTSKSPLRVALIKIRFRRRRQWYEAVSQIYTDIFIPKGVGWRRSHPALVRWRFLDM